MCLCYVSFAVLGLRSWHAPCECAARHDLSLRQTGHSGREHRMMSRPRGSHDLRLVNTKLVIAPRPTAIRWVHDAFDNSVGGAAHAWLQIYSPGAGWVEFDPTNGIIAVCSGASLL